MDFAHTLYILRSDGNDYYFNRIINPSIVAASLLNGVKDLLKIGVKHLLIVNQSPVQIMPFIHTQEQATFFKERTVYHNNNLSIGISKLEYNREHVSLYLFDVYSFILKIIANNSIYSFNTKNSCWDILNNTVVSSCSNPESYIFIDQYHYTACMHELIADGARQVILSSSTMIKSSYSVYTILCSVVFLRL
jgi:thermolabile hemolysin